MDTPASLTSKRIGCIGCGNMGGAILGGSPRFPVWNSTATTARLSVLSHSVPRA